MTTPFLHGWDDVEALFADFSRTRYMEPRPKEPYEDKVEVLFAWLASYGYEESAVIVYRQDGKLFCSEASHCSCMGFEDQFEGTPTTPGALRLMAEGRRGWGGEWGGYEEALRALADRLENEEAVS